MTNPPRQIATPGEMSGLLGRIWRQSTRWSGGTFAIGGPPAHVFDAIDKIGKGGRKRAFRSSETGDECGAQANKD